jgi:6-phospho-beta-glucosidase
MKIAVIGGGSLRTPLLVNGLTRSDLPIDEIGLYDTDQDRLSIVARLAQEYSAAARPYADVRACVSGAAFVVVSIRVGGIAARARDEAISLEHGTVGQETVGAGGFAMAVRTIPHVLEYARLVAREAPRAWVVNFTNPVSIVTQAIRSHTSARAIGICDTPTELFEDVARVLGVDAPRCHFDYFGLNHLGWLREVYFDGEPQLERVWRDPARIGRIYRAPLFDARFVQMMRLLPTEYLFYYYFPHAAIDNMKKAGATRGQTIVALNEQLFRDLAASRDRRGTYERYLAARDASYMQIEAGAAGSTTRSSASRATPVSLSGYDKIALHVIRGIHFDANAIIPLNVRNRGTLEGLEDEDIVEVPCVVNANGAHPLSVPGIPDHVRELLVRVKEYERLTIDAAIAGSKDAAVRALARNPLVGEPPLAERLVNALQVL